MAFRRTMPVLQVRDTARAIAFYQRLGFVGNNWADANSGDIVFAIMQRGEVTIALQLLRGEPRVNTHWAAYLYVDDIDAVHAEFIAEGLQPTAIRRNTDYACDDFDLIDPDGHILAFGQDRSPTNGPGLGTGKGRDA